MCLERIFIDTRATVADRIERMCKERNITINALSYISGVSNSTFKSIFYKQSKNPGVVTVKKFVTVL